MRLRTRDQYIRMARCTSKFTGTWLIIDIRPTQFPVSRLGITVTRRYGNACVRNRFKRIVREAFRQSYSQFPQSIDISVRPRSRALNATMGEIKKELMEFIHAFSSHPS